MTKRSRRGVSFPFKVAILGATAAGIAYTVRQQRRIEFGGKTVLIAGASRGLGLELARAFADEGANLALLARDQGQLEEGARELQRKGVRVSTHRCDITKHDEVRQSVQAVVADHGTIDVLVNNAGIIQVGPAEHMSIEDYASAMAVHFWGPLYLSTEVIPHMKRQGHGRIVNITSIGGKVAVPHLLPYVASKFALVGLSEGMRAELAKDGIYVTTVCPGLMRTGSHLNAMFKGKQKIEFALFSITNASPLLSMSFERAARQIIEACRYGKAEIVLTPQARLARLIHGLFPGLVAESLGLLSRVMPGPGGPDGDRLMRGWESQSLASPSFLTRPADRASERNREHPKTGTP